jgi:hypothetical protein
VQTPPLKEVPFRAEDVFQSKFIKKHNVYDV